MGDAEDESAVSEYLSQAATGDAVRLIANALWSLCETCPVHGTDDDRIDEWHDILPSLSLELEGLCRFAGWPEGAQMARAIDDHFRALPYDGDEPLSSEWMQGLRRRCRDLYTAADDKWPEDEDDDECAS